VPILSLKQYSKEQLQEFSLIELAYEFLNNSKQPIAFNDLVNEIATAAGTSAEEIRTRLAQFYTDMNIDGRFLALGENRWGLRVWYPVDTVEEEVVTSAKPKKKKAKKVVDEDVDVDEFDETDEMEEEDYDDLDDFADDEDLGEDEDDFDDIDDLDEDDDVIDEDEDLDEDLDEDDELVDEDEEEEDK
jgi:DNA-directed RNA polymerase subunit delta